MMKTRKNLLCILLAMTMLLMMVTPAVFIASADDDITWTFDEETGTLVFSGVGTVEKSDEVDAMKAEIKHVVFEDGITEIGYKAFWRFPAIESIEMTSVVTVGYGAFNNIESLKTVDFGVVERIEDWAFTGAVNVTDSLLPETLKYVGVSAFCGSTSWIIPALPKHIEYLGNHAFYNCKKINSTLIIPEDVTYIGDGCFMYCPITSVLMLNHDLEQMQRYYPTEQGPGSSIFGFRKLESFIVVDPDLPVEMLSYWKTDNPLIYDDSNLTIYAPVGSKTEEFAASRGLKFASIDELVLGDFLGTGSVTSADVRAMTQAVVSDTTLSATQWYTFDVNKDGKCNTSDVHAVLKGVVG